MPAYHVQRSIVINAPSEKVFDTVSDFSCWPKWSPRLGIDKDAEVIVSDDPRSLHSIYSWRGELVGEGEIEHIQLERPRLISDEIRIRKPFKSRSNVKFEIASDRDGTKITWHMLGKLPWFMFWMKSNMETFIGMDYERGLKMLREHIETGNVLSRTEFVGVEPVAGIDVYGVHNSCSMDEISPAMEKAVATTTAKLSENGIATDGDMVSAYHPVDLRKRRFDFTSGYSVTPDREPPAGLAHCRLPAGKALHIRHTGSYENLGNSWSGAYQYARYKKIKIARQDAFEIYRNNPSNTPAAELVTDIYLPIK